MTDVKVATAVAVEPVLVGKPVAAAMLGGISEFKLDELVRAGLIKAQRIDRRVVFSPDELRRYAAACPEWEPK
ncbi:hypothetical protein [Mycolicibacterium fortuitum]|uniref:hypothetical protein n=1 Tax=Mycolicibacterium fortuitum TaxID=1766 RepID=UPI00262F3D0F|nr:hypothetical protein [Mycolicibacterium fortuitum]